MALSNSIDFTLTRDTCITQALAQLGVLGEGETPTAAQYADDAVTLNLMLKHWQNKPVAQNLIRRFYVWLDDEKRVYDLSTTATSSDHSAYNFYRDTLGSDYADGGTTLTVTTGTGAADGDTLLVVSDESTLLAGDVESGGATTSLTVPDLNGDAESGSAYFAYTTKVTRPLEILYANRVQAPTSIGEDTALDYVSTPVRLWNRSDYVRMAAKGAEGATSGIWYDPQWPTAQLYVWPEPSAAGELLECWGQFTIDDMDSSSNNFALPSQWYATVMWNLALWLTPKYGASDKTYGKIQRFAMSTLEDAEVAESETSVQFQPDRRR